MNARGAARLAKNVNLILSLEKPRASNQSTGIVNHEFVVSIVFRCSCFYERSDRSCESGRFYPRSNPLLSQVDNTRSRQPNSSCP